MWARSLWRKQRAAGTVGAAGTVTPAVTVTPAKMPGAVIPCGWKTRKRSDYVFLRYGIQSL